MEIAGIIVLAAATLGASLLIVVFVGSRHGWTRHQTTRVAASWGVRLWLNLALLSGGFALIVAGQVQGTWLGGLFLIVLGGVGVVLALRALPGAVGNTGLLSANGELSPRSFDYLVWSSLGVVALAVVLLGAVLLAGGK